MQRPDEVKAGVAGLFGRLAPTYDTVIPFFDTFARALIDTAAIGRGERVLDLACGRGACLRATVAAVGGTGSVVGVDLSPGMVELTASEVAAAGLTNVDVRVGDAEHLELETGSFDIVVCGFGVFFFPQPDAALVEVRRVLRGGGRVAASTFTDGVAGYPWAADVIRELGRAPTLSPSPVRTAEGLRAALHRAGFDGVTTTTVQASFVIPDLETYVAWSWSNGNRRMLETFDDDEMRRFRDASAARLRDHAVDGGFEYTQHVDITLGSTPR